MLLKSQVLILLCVVLVIFIEIAIVFILNMTNEIENIIDLFDELYVFETKEELATKVGIDVVSDSTNTTSVPKVEEVSSTVSEIEPAVETSLPTLQNESFVETQPELTASQNEPIVQIPLNYSGANKRLIAIIYNDIINDSRQNVEMLSNLITKALKFSMDDVAVVRLSKNKNHTIEEIIDQLQSKYAIVWGAPESFTHQTIHQINQINQTRLLVTDFVHQYNQNNDYKVKLWTAIQSLFAL
jgi:hypothetical protein